MKDSLSVKQNSKANHAQKVKQFVKQTVNGKNLEKTLSENLASKSGIPGEIRTHDPLLRRQLLCPAELQGRIRKNTRLVFFAFLNYFFIS